MSVFKAKPLMESILKMSEYSGCLKLRVFEEDKSYEDFSISKKLTGDLLPNFTVEEDMMHLIIRKKARKSTRHILFYKDALWDLEIRGNKKKYIALNIHSIVYYTDGTHRYRVKPNALD